MTTGGRATGCGERPLCGLKDSPTMAVPVDVANDLVGNGGVLTATTGDCLNCCTAAMLPGGVSGLDTITGVGIDLPPPTGAAEAVALTEAPAARKPGPALVAAELLTSRTGDRDRGGLDTPAPTAMLLLGVGETCLCTAYGA